MRSLPLLELAEKLNSADVVLVVPPFAGLDNPSLGVHLLQACGRRAGFRVRVLYANLLLAAVMGQRVYERIAPAPPGSFAGERFFARCAYGVRPLGRNASTMFDWALTIPDADDDVVIASDLDGEQVISLRRLVQLEAKADWFIDSLAKLIHGTACRVVGCTTSFEQTSASVALLNRIKDLNPKTMTMLGGANCEGEMAEGIRSLGARIDYIFSGDSEATFVDAVRAILAGSPPPESIVRGAVCTDLDLLPTPDFTEFFEQRRRVLAGSAEKETFIPYETSRGCWWGQKHHCTFCGLNGERMAFRQKSPDRVMEELRVLLASVPMSDITMTDNIMPFTYFSTLLPRMARELAPHSITYEQKANLTLGKIVALKEAGITLLALGIEALSSSLLKLMGKGLRARQNLELLRDVRIAGMQVSWALLWGLPGDQAEAYEETLAMVPLLHHLPPPDFLLHLKLHRFSPYFSRPAEFNIRHIAPLSPYYDFLPKKADVNRIAYDFTAKYKCGSHTHLHIIRELWEALERWRASWAGNEQPSEDLRISMTGRGSYILHDTRRMAVRKKRYTLDATEAASLLSPRPYSSNEFDDWALDRKLATVLDGWFVPLPVADLRLVLQILGPPGKTSIAGAEQNYHELQVTL